ncbi:unnamed protein product [Cuscuta campestris]|uniref:RNase H type-1 domain-containing protein n=1 Tax=Cuscuta campestris TaxID=132261 RepID=A0A484LNZ6_9ASTE|nr:unnamed protein product [Cuscuta campestris]
MNSFWWTSKGSSSTGIRWMSWNRLSVPKKFGGMGFKQLHSFNVAMLGKQGWRLLTQPDALVSRVFKASILKAQPLIRQGVRRRVGNGRNTLVWGSPWLLDSDNPTIMTDQQFMPNFPVNFLKDPVTGGWNESLLHSYFNARDVMEILRVPSCPSREDLWFWSRSPHGHYSVKDGYRLLQGEVVAESTGFSAWNKLWRIPVETKVKVVIWRALRGISPTISSLNSKGMELDNLCPICGEEGETTDHIFVFCSYALAIWEGVGAQVSRVAGGSFIHFFEGLFGSRSMGELKVIAYAVWALWKTRNATVWDGRVSLPAVTIRLIKSLAERWPDSRLGHQLTPPSCSILGQQSSGQVQHCFVDAALFPQVGEVGFGAVLLDPGGRFVEAFNGTILCSQDPLLAEAIAVREALAWLKREACLEVQLFSDSWMVVNAINHVTVSRSYFGSIIEECRLFLSSFRSICISHVCRDLNGVAHVLARRAVAQLGVWEYVPPDFIVSHFN